MKYSLVKNTELDLSFLEETLKTRSEMEMVNPSAKFPFELNYWMNFFNLGNPTSSYLLKINNTVIGHSSLQLKKEDQSVWLCWVLLDPKYRGTNASEFLINSTEQYLKEEFKKDEYFLNVRQNNEIAIKFYKRMRFKLFSENNGNYQMKKNII